MALSDRSAVEALALELLEAERLSRPVKAFSERIDGFTTEDGYRIQEALINLKVAQGRTVIGKKVGFTSERLRRQFGVDEPDYGVLLDDCVLTEDEPLQVDQLIAPRVEAEIAFVLHADLDKPCVTVADVCTATAGIMPAIEIVDSRFQDWRITVPDTIADNAANARIVLGGSLRPLAKYDLRYIGLTLYRNGSLVDSATGANVMGNPIHAVVWLANKMYRLGRPLKAGEIIMSGSFTPVFEIGHGDYVEAYFDRLGKVSITAR